MTMGAGNSRRKPAASASMTNVARMTFGANIPPPKAGYFILSLKPDKIKVVNAEAGVLRLLAAIIRRHVDIVKEGWDRHLTYCYRLRVSGCSAIIQLVADTLMGLYQSGWEPMTPLEMTGAAAGAGAATDIVTRARIDICFRSKVSGSRSLGLDTAGSVSSLADSGGDHSCLCVQTFKDSDLICHNVSNTVLHELVTAVMDKWDPGVKGVSPGVASVIQDYTQRMPPVLGGSRTGVDSLNDKLIRLEGRPWRRDNKTGDGDQLQTVIIGCVTRLGYRLSMDITLDIATNTRVFFLIKTGGRGEDSGCLVTVPNNSGAGLGEKETLCVYRPLLLRHKSSFFRSYHGKTESFRRKLRASMRRKVLTRAQHTKQPGARDTREASSGDTGGDHSDNLAPAMRYKQTSGQPAWWQQVSTDSSAQRQH